MPQERIRLNLISNIDINIVCCFTPKDAELQLKIIGKRYMLNPYDWKKGIADRDTPASLFPIKNFSFVSLLLFVNSRLLIC